MITTDFNKIPYEDIFQSGITTDNSDGINMSNSGQTLKWIAKKGGGDDWAIYIHFEWHSDDFIKKHGQKISDRDNIRKLILCDDEMFNKYRF